MRGKALKKEGLTRLLAPVLLVTGMLMPLAGSIPVGAQSTGLQVHFPAPPLASAGSIGPGQSASFTARITNNGSPDPGGTIYLAQVTRVSGDATLVPSSQCFGVSQLPTSGSAIPCTSDSSGKVLLTYQVPAQPPASHASSQWIGEASPTSSQHATEHYVYATVYRLTPSPIAPSGSLAAGASTPVTLTADDALGQGVAGSIVYLSMKAASGGGSASVGATKLTTTPTAFTTDSTGSLTLTYTAPKVLPTSGADAISVQDAAKSPKEKTSDSYAFLASTPVLSIGDSTVFEGDQNPGIPAEFTVSIAPVQPAPVTFNYVTICGIGDKNCGEDFVQVFSAVSVTIPANTSSAIVLVRQFSYIGGNGGETYVEGWFVQISSPSVGIVGRAVGNGLLLPDVENTSVALPDLYTGSAGVVPVMDAGGVPIYFAITLGAIESGSVTFQYATSDGSAVAGVDYVATSGTATIPAGQTSAVVAVTIEPDPPPGISKTFSLTISGATGGATISSAVGTGSILTS